MRKKGNTDQCPYSKDLEQLLWRLPLERTKAVDALDHVITTTCSKCQEVIDGYNLLEDFRKLHKGRMLNLLKQKGRQALFDELKFQYGEVCSDDNLWQDVKMYERLLESANG